VVYGGRCRSPQRRSWPAAGSGHRFSLHRLRPRTSHTLLCLRYDAVQILHRFTEHRLCLGSQPWLVRSAGHLSLHEGQLRSLAAFHLSKTFQPETPTKIDRWVQLATIRPRTYLCYFVGARIATSSSKRRDRICVWFLTAVH
jgi:hypothetical protein